MEPTKETDPLYRDRIRRARKVSLEDNLLAGAELFDLACEFMRAGIRANYPDADEQRVETILRERLALSRRLETS